MDTVHIPERYHGSMAAIRPPTPVSDELERRLAPVVARLEAGRPDGKHPAAAGLARVVVLIRRSEGVLSGAAPSPDEQVARAKEIVSWGRQQLMRADLTEVLRDVSKRAVVMRPR